MPVEALRSIVGTARRRPAKLAYFVASLGLSFGFIAAVVTLAHAGWFRLPVGVADQAYVTALRETGGGFQSMSIRDFDEIVARVPEVSWFYAMPAYWLTLEAAGSSGVPEPLEPQLVSPDFFEQLGVLPENGTLVPAEGVMAAVIADEVWRRVYGRQDVVGELLSAEDGTAVPIIGVAPPGFTGPMQLPTDTWLMNAPLCCLHHGLARPSMRSHGTALPSYGRMRLCLAQSARVGIRRPSLPLCAPAWQSIDSIARWCSCSRSQHPLHPMVRKATRVLAAT